jgi:hypothetical protein
MSKPLAILYFTRDKTEIANDIAARIRNEGNLVNMVYAGGFRDADQCVKCEAVIIQESFGRTPMIVDAYQNKFPDAEIHLYTDDGEFNDEAYAAPADAGAEEKAVDSKPAEEETSDDAESEESDDDGEKSTVTE